MPELPEVERFRQLLLPLVGTTTPSASSNNQQHRSTAAAARRVTDDDALRRTKMVLRLPRDQLYPSQPPRKWLSEEQMEVISGHYSCVDVQRKGKLLGMVLDRYYTVDDDGGSSEDHRKDSGDEEQRYYLFLHMGMTGRISTRNSLLRLKSLKTSKKNRQKRDEEDEDGQTPADDAGEGEGAEYPPPHTYLMLQTDSYEVCFSDPRKFGSCELTTNMEPFDLLAPDAFFPSYSGKGSNNNDDSEVVVEEQILPKLANQSTGIKAMLLDQKRVVSGVGNWIADEVCYQCQIHPDQSFLSDEQAKQVFDSLATYLDDGD